MSVSPMLDPEALSWLGVDKARADAVLEAFLATASADLQILESDAGNAQRVGQAAHRLSGAAGMVGAGELEQIARRIEAAARVGDCAGAGLLASEVRAALGRLRQLLREGRG
jgi:HPt (histidine-containing phosphotransfer) domain-containing protein